MAKVAKKAEVSGGYLYRHYESKESLINELYIEKFKELSENLIDKITNNTNLKDVIFEFYLGMVEKMFVFVENDDRLFNENN
ncbi:MAG: hypothetical protein CR961_01950 [Polaribacter sp.]|nr:MAG: hypothetical protein CR961_01950 [Polaribacter sp.]